MLKTFYAFVRQILKNGFLENEYLWSPFPELVVKRAWLERREELCGQIHLGKQNFLDLEKQSYFWSNPVFA